MFSASEWHFGTAYLVADPPVVVELRSNTGNLTESL